MSSFQLGVIEGFYGRDWTDADRLSLISWLADRAYHSYLYAPKSDASLRGQWAREFNDAEMRKLEAIATSCRAAGLSWGVGLSPLGAVDGFGSTLQAQMQAKLQQLNKLQIDVLAILFDDMHCSHADLAIRQTEIVSFITQASTAAQFIVCPSYYSDDPVLEKVFGERPPGYWQDFGKGLPEQCSVFWTGPKVCSSHLHADDLRRVQSMLGRPVTLWDNYPVNDGEKASQFLHINAFTGRDPELADCLAGHYCNPMNQCHLSRLPLETLPQLYAEGSAYNPGLAFQQALRRNLDEPLAQLLASHRELFAEQGLSCMDAGSRESLQASYAEYSHPAAREVREWLAGEYRFDPACLTEDVP